jgi:hypothetical protein
MLKIEIKKWEKHFFKQNSTIFNNIAVNQLSHYEKTGHNIRSYCQKDCKNYKLN